MGCKPNNLRTSMLALCLSIECWTLVWQPSANTAKIDTQLLPFIRIISGMSGSTPIQWFLNMTTISPLHPRRKAASHTTVRTPTNQIPGWKHASKMTKWNVDSVCDNASKHKERSQENLSTIWKKASENQHRLERLIGNQPTTCRNGWRPNFSLYILHYYQGFS